MEVNGASPPIPNNNNKSESASPYSDTDDEDWSILSPLNNKRHHSMSNQHDLHLIDELTEKVLLHDKMYTLTPNKFDDDSSIPRSMNNYEPLIKDHYKDNDVVNLLLNLRS